MAITVTKLGLIDPTPALLQSATPPADLQHWMVDITLGATTDYTATGLDLTNTLLIGAAGLNVSQVATVTSAAVRTSGGTLRSIDYKFDQNGKTLRLFREGNNLFTNATQRQNQTNVVTAPSVAASQFTLAANTLNTNGKGVRYRAWGALASVANTRTAALLVGATFAQPPVGGTSLISVVATANAFAGAWFYEVDVIRTGTGTQQIIARGHATPNATATTTNMTHSTLFTAGTFDETTALTFVPTVLGTSTNDITIEGQTADVIGLPGANAVEIVPANDLATGDVLRLGLVCV